MKRISFEQAKLLAPFYDEMQDAYYRGGDGQFFTGQIESLVGFSDNSNRHRISAPYMEEVVTWLRERYKIYAWIVPALTMETGKVTHHSECEKISIHNETLQWQLLTTQNTQLYFEYDDAFTNMLNHLINIEWIF
jgi:hypothetical protein